MDEELVQDILDDLVIDAFTQQASDLNNAGAAAQIEFLVNYLGHTEFLKAFMKEYTYSVKESK